MGKLYATCENKCKKEVISKEASEEMNENIQQRQKKILYGTSDPSNALGEDGDVYIKIEG